MLALHLLPDSQTRRLPDHRTCYNVCPFCIMQASPEGPGPGLPHSALEKKGLEVARTHRTAASTARRFSLKLHCICQDKEGCSSSLSACPPACLASGLCLPFLPSLSFIAPSHRWTRLTDYKATQTKLTHSNYNASIQSSTPLRGQPVHRPCWPHQETGWR